MMKDLFTLVRASFQIIRLVKEGAMHHRPPARVIDQILKGVFLLFSLLIKKSCRGKAVLRPKYVFSRAG